MKLIYNKLVAEDIASKTIDLYLKQQDSPYPELLYFTYYNRLVLYFFTQEHRDASSGGMPNSFRMCFNEEVKVLSIHYYESPYSRVDYAGLLLLQKYVDLDIIENSKVLSKMGTSEVCLGRNLRMMKRKRKLEKEVAMQYSIVHKIGDASEKKLVYKENAEDLVLVKKRCRPEEDMLVHMLEQYAEICKKFSS